MVNKGALLKTYIKEMTEHKWNYDCTGIKVREEKEEYDQKNID